MILVADSGSTKTNWCLLKPKEQLFYFDTEGYNPYFVSSSHVVESLTAGLPRNIDPLLLRAIYFYGAGCFEDKTGIIKNALQEIFSHADIFIGLDLLGSARSLLGNKPGFTAILGTGTNTCLYDGIKIIANIDSLGYILGDEGSGFYIGRKILSDYIRGYMPVSVRQEFFKMYGLSREAIMGCIYTEKMPNRFCARFTRFITASVADTKYTISLVRNAFVDFFECLVTKYNNYEKYTFNCTGSIGFAFKELLAETAALYNMEVGVIVKAPIEGLANFHQPEGYK